jgi:hypothetical protein
VETDPELFDIIEREKQRQRNCISLIASEVRGGFSRPPSVVIFGIHERSDDVELYVDRRAGCAGIGHVEQVLGGVPWCTVCELVRLFVDGEVDP